MTYLVPRTCTVVGDEASRAGPENASRPVEFFRETYAYVLLGAPGAGKTEAFKLEAEHSGGCYVTARDFITFDDKPEWRGTTLFIDGLDEARAGSTDGRTQFDRIRAKLDRLGRPMFRLSCREADWFGATDKDCLQTVSRDGKVTVLRLDPISENDVCEILRRNYGIEDTDGFVASAREKGIDTLLTNPQSLKMLVKAAPADGILPETRLKTFDMACQTLLREFNREHRLANRDCFDIPCLMDAAGRLCALQLLTGGAGYTGDGGESDRDFPAFETIPGEDRGILRDALSTPVFEWTDQRRAAPAHRQIAEFLGARYLAGLIGEGLPVGRVLALMMGHDGVVVSELRGLAAWLAAHGKSSRGEIIARDPLGTVLYGDVRGFSSDEKHRLLTCLEREATRNPWLIAGIQLDSRLGDIVTPDMETHFREILAVPARDDARQAFIVIVIEMLAHGPALPGLADFMMDIVRDATWWSRIRQRAFKAFVRNHGDREKAIAELERLLLDVDAGAVPDADDDLLGRLLTELYPDRLSTPEVLQYLRTPKAGSYFGIYQAFWTRRIPEKSTNAQLAELLDTIVLRFNRLKPVFERFPGQLNLLRPAPFRLLQCALETSQDDIAPDRLYDWLGVASNPELRAPENDSEAIRKWLSSNPAILKKIIKLGVEDCLGSEDFRRCMYGIERRFFDAKPPEYGQWCLEQAVAATDSATASYFLAEALDAEYREKQQRHIVEKRIVGDTFLEGIYKKHQEEKEEREQRPRNQYERVQKEREAQKKRIQREWHDQIKPHEAALRENEAPSALLHHLAKVYYDEFVDVQGNTPTDRLRDLMGSDENLIAAVLEGFCGAIARSDVPSDAEILNLSVRNLTHHLSLPILAGLQEAAQRVPIGDPFLDETPIRLALAIYYTVPTPIDADWPPDWFPPLLVSHPREVADLRIRSATSMMRCGADYVPGLHELLSEDHAAVARLATLPLLKAFPVRCKASQLPILSDLFRAALLHCETESFLELIDKKLAHRSMNVAQRVYWMAAGLSVSPELYLNTLEPYVAGNERRIRHLAAFLADNDRSLRLIEGFDARVLRVLIRLIGGSCKPFSNAFRGASRMTPKTVTSAMFAGSNVEAYIKQLAAIASAPATDTLEELASDDNLRAWRSLLIDAAYRQSTARREAGFRHCDFGQVLDTLDNRKPANAADLGALTFEYLREISKDIRDGNASAWRRYWNAESPQLPRDPRPEDWCRDALLWDLQKMLTPLGIDAQAEAHYADGKRSDIRVSFGGFNVPVEIKKSCSRDLWSAIETQLIAKYTRDPGADGHGIYLVFWFGNTEHCRPTPGEGTRPKSAAELEERLRDTLSVDQRRKISICVIDVAKPEA